MNASALLTSQGWLGPGHALDSRLTDYGAQTYKQKGHRGLAYDPSSNVISATTTGGNGLIKPLLVSQRGTSRRGIGKKAHEPTSGNEWWLKGFASALANIGSGTTSAATSGASTPTTQSNGNVFGTNNGYPYGGKHSGLYSYFVAGQMMKGTIDDEESEAARKGKKRKSDVLEEDPLKVKPVKRVQTAKELENAVSYLEERDKTRKKGHQRLESSGVEQFAAVGAFLGVVEPPRKKKSSPVEQEDEMEIEESKEERRARRKKQKEKGKTNGNLTLAQMVEEELARLSSKNNSEQESDSTRSKRKADRKKKRRRREKEMDEA